MNRYTGDAYDIEKYEIMGLTATPQTTQSMSLAGRERPVILLPKTRTCPRNGYNIDIHIYGSVSGIQLVTSTLEIVLQIICTYHSTSTKDVVYQLLHK